MDESTRLKRGLGFWLLVFAKITKYLDNLPQTKSFLQRNIQNYLGTVLVITFDKRKHILGTLTFKSFSGIIVELGLLRYN